MRKVVIVISILVVLVGVTAWLNRGGLEEKRRSQEDAVLLVKQGESEFELTFAELLNLPQQEFDAVLRSSSKPPEDTSFKGVELRAVLQSLGVDPAGVEQVVTVAVDGYTVALSGDEIRLEDNVYIVYERDGEDLGTRDSGGSGPYQLVIREDEFGQRWNKFLMRIEIN